MALDPEVKHHDFTAVVARHLARYPALQLEDVYKLAHQACLGSGHAVSDRAHAEHWLDREIEGMGDGPAEPTIDPISPDGSVVRVHLRPYLVAGGEAPALLDAFVSTANEYRGSIEELGSCLARVEAMAAAGALPFSAAEARALAKRMREAGFPAVHHSAAFVAAYRPAYRVVAREYLVVGLAR